MSESRKKVIMLESSYKLDLNRSTPIRKHSSAGGQPAAYDTVNNLALKFKTTQGAEFAMKLKTKHRSPEVDEIDQILAIARNMIIENFETASKRSSEGRVEMEEESMPAHTDVEAAE